MCRGIRELENQSRNLCVKQSFSISCELCGTRASLYCQADKAFLCRKCDRWVHHANFLAKRHVRRVLCTACQKLTRRCLVGDRVAVVLRPGFSQMLRRSEEADHVGVETEGFIRF